MIIRNLDTNHDWTFGAGKNNYRTGINAIAEDIDTRLLCFIGDCFWNLTFGLNWIVYLGSRNMQEEIQLEVASAILNTENVISVENLSLNLTQDRKINLTYTVDTALGRLNGEVFYNL